MNVKKTRVALGASALALALAATGCSMNISDKPASEASSAQQSTAAPSAPQKSRNTGTADNSSDQGSDSGDAPAASDGGGQAQGSGSSTDGASGGSSASAVDNGSDVAQQYGVDPNNPGPVLGEGRSAIQWDDGDKATMVTTLHSLKRDGNTVVAVFSFTPTVEGGSEETQPLYWALGNSGPWEPALIDTKNLNRHGPLAMDNEDAPRDYMRSDALKVELADGQTTYAYAVFAAPPEDVTSMDVIMGDGMPALKDVPLQ